MTEFNPELESFGVNIFNSAKFIRSALWIAELDLGQPFLGVELANAVGISSTQSQREIVKLNKVHMVELYEGNMPGYEELAKTKPWMRLDHPGWQIIELARDILS